MPRALVLALLLALVLVAPAAAESVTASDQTTSATLTWTPPADDGIAVTGLRLTIVKDGATLFDADPGVSDCVGDDAMCAVDDPPLRVDDIDADGVPDIVVRLFTGGAHCCWVAKAFLATGTTVERNFGNAGDALRDLDADGVPEFLSTDDRFSYRFASYANSGRPLQVFRIRDNRLRDVTRSFPAAIRKDARRWKKLYKQALREGRDAEPHGLLAPWVADQYLLGRGRQARSFVRGQLANGNLDKGSRLIQTNGRRFVRKLDKAMRRFGYR